MTLFNYFDTCGFPMLKEEKLTAQFGSTAIDYVVVDVALETENTASDISHIIKCKQIEQEEESGEEESN